MATGQYVVWLLFSFGGGLFFINMNIFFEENSKKVIEKHKIKKATMLASKIIISHLKQYNCLPKN